MNFETEDVRYQTLEEYPYPEYPYTMPPEVRIIFPVNPEILRKEG